MWITYRLSETPSNSGPERLPNGKLLVGFFYSPLVRDLLWPILLGLLLVFNVNCMIKYDRSMIVEKPHAEAELHQMLDQIINQSIERYASQYFLPFP